MSWCCEATSQHQTGASRPTLAHLSACLAGSWEAHPVTRNGRPRHSRLDSVPAAASELVDATAACWASRHDDVTQAETVTHSRRWPRSPRRWSDLMTPVLYLAYSSTTQHNYSTTIMQVCYQHYQLRTKRFWNLALFYDTRLLNLLTYLLLCCSLFSACVSLLMAISAFE